MFENNNGCHATTTINRGNMITDYIYLVEARIRSTSTMHTILIITSMIFHVLVVYINFHYAYHTHYQHDFTRSI